MIITIMSVYRIIVFLSEFLEMFKYLVFYNMYFFHESGIFLKNEDQAKNLAW